MRIIRGLEMFQYNDNQEGWNNRGKGVLGEIDNSNFLSEHVSFRYSCKQ